MAGGGDKFDLKILYMLQNVGLFLPFFLAIYGALILAGLVTASPAFTPTGYFFVIGSLVVLSIYQYAFQAKTYGALAVRITLYHVIAYAYVMLIAGLSSPFLVSWAILMLVSHIYFKWKGFFLSLSGLVYTFISAWFVFSIPTEAILGFTLTMITSVFAALIAVVINNRKEQETAEVEKSHHKEQAQRDRTLTLINNLTDAILGVDHSGTVQIYNAAFFNLLDINSLPENRHIDSIVQLYDKDEKPVSLKKLLHESKSVTLTDAYQIKLDEEFLRLELTYAPIRGGNTTKDEAPDYMLILRDVTKAKSLEEERDEFISVVSHELRTPIAITEGAIDNARLIFEKDSSKKEAVKDTLKLAHDQIIFLSKMVNDLSTLSRAERGVADETEVIDIQELAHSLYDEYAPQAKEKRLHFNLNAHGKLGYVDTSRLYLQELLQNFITNSIKYTKSGSIELTITRDKDIITFSVADTGIGISKSDQAKIFQKFYRSEDYRTRETGGTGLGLYVAVKLAKKLGTVINVKSRLNHGSTFSFELPARQDIKIAKVKA
ncbi:MAG TPA: ATP-binding protein [Candidatus Saccharimonadales bacterium]